MKTAMLVCAILCVCSVHGQDFPRKIYVNPSVGFFRLTTDKNSINNIPLMFEGKIGMRLKKKDGLGLQFSSASQSVPTSGLSSIQPSGGGSVWTRYGTRKQKVIALGIFYERFFSIGKRIDFFPSTYAQYLNYKDEERGNIVAGTDSSMTYARATLYNYIGRVGLNFNFQYAITKSTSLTVRFAQIDCRIWNKYEQNVSLELPLLLGIKYLFK